MPVSSELSEPFRRVRHHDGYLPIADHGLIGDGATAALVGIDGGISWMCLPRFDSDAVFCSILDTDRGGAFRVGPERPREARQVYLEDTGILITQIRDDDGLVEITDALTLRTGAVLTEDVNSGRGELVRRVRILDGTMRLRIDFAPRGGAGARRSADGLSITSARRPDLSMHLAANRELDGLRSIVELRAGEVLDLVLRWGGPPHRYHVAPDGILEATADAWRRWVSCIRYDGPQQPLVRRSAITLKMLDHFENGAMVAAPTSSLPEGIGGVRNWDYRFAWVRDAAFSVYALRRIGMKSEAWGFLGWVLDAVERTQTPLVLYDLDGGRPPHEFEDGDLEGYRGSTPVRWGNAAADQTQHDAYGEILDCAYQWAVHGRSITPQLWKRLRSLVDDAAARWDRPDHGIWEVRTEGQVFTYSAAMCQVALDRGARLAERFGLDADVEGWRREAARIGDQIFERAWDPKREAITEHLGRGALDASVLALPLRRVIEAADPRMVSTVKAVVSELGAGDGLLYRYLPEVSPDGLEGDEGAFLLCSFWLVDNLALQGRLDEAMALYDSLCARANPAGLLPEQIDASTGEFLGNFPQAFSHVGVISSGVTLQRALQARDG